MNQKLPDHEAYLAKLAGIVRRDGHLGLYDNFSPNLLCARQAATEVCYFTSPRRAARCADGGCTCSSSELAAQFARAATRYIALFAHVPATPAGNHEF